MRPLSLLRTTRRTTIGGALLGLVGVTGCDLVRPSPDTGRPPQPSADPDPDATLLEAVVAELDELVALVEESARRRPRLASELASFAALHQAHRGVLPERPDDGPPPAVVGSAADQAARVLRREELARRRLADWSVAADSGPLARLLASMSAGVAAQLAATELGRAG